jgi:restriction endonuclease S subunit
LLEGLEVTEIPYSKLDKLQKRLDSEYYKKEYVKILDAISTVGSESIAEKNIKLDCSAFYPSITGYYNFEMKGVPFLRVNEIKKGIIKIDSNTAFLPESVLTENSSTIKLAYPDDIIVAKGGNTLAKLAILTDDYPVYALCRDVILLKTSELDKNDKYFLWAFLHSEFGQALLWRTASQTGQPHLTLKAIEKIAIPKYSTTFENKFVSIYKKSVELKKESDNLLRKAESILMDELGLKNWSPTSENIQIVSFKNSLMGSGRLDAEYYQHKYEEIEEKIYDYKNGCDTLDNLFSIINGKTPDKYFEVGNDVQILKTRNIRSELNDFENLYYTSNDYVDNYLMHKDVLFASMGVGSLGRTGIFYEFETDRKTWVDSTIKVLRRKKNFSAEVLQIFLNLRVIQEYIYRYIVGSTGIISIKNEDLMNIKIPLVDLTVQEIISKKILKAHEARIESQKLLEVAKKGVEEAINRNEIEASIWIENNLKKLGIIF